MKLTELKGIGPKTEELFSKVGVHDVLDLLNYFPRDYELFSDPGLISDIGFRSYATIRGAFTAKPTVLRKKNLKITTGYFKDETGMPIKVVWFNSPFIKDSIKTGELYVLRGKVSQKFGVKQIEQPKLYKALEYSSLLQTEQPIYPLTKGLSNNMIVKAVKEALETGELDRADEKDPIPDIIKKEYQLCERSFAIKNLHFPENDDHFRKALKRMSFEEIFLFIYMMKSREKIKPEKTDIVIKEHDKTKEFISKLDYQLTGAQQKVLDEIMKDVSSGYPMSRLLQGDVGSGKTIVSLIALMNAAYSGYQGALMAPTEVLAAQHYEFITKIFKEKGIGLSVALLTGSMTALEKKVVYNALVDGKTDIVIGTHALIQDKVEFNNLGLVITDEQHRFGIKQREALTKKAGTIPHVLVMSATPIPRTLALIVYGGMDVSIIDELPSGRKQIKNAVIDESLRDNAYRLMKREVEKGHQVYIICPLIEYSDGMDAQNVTDYTEMLKEVFESPIVIGMLHGQMSAEKKNEIMGRFAAGKIDILVSTTVIEVGVNVPNATVMMIEDANRFGLSSLHQLRGRVGRGDDQSYCIFLSSNKSKESMERLSVLGRSNDGFEIASKDLELRGPGEIIGIRQSGALSFKNFDVLRDADKAYEASKAVDEVIEKNIKIQSVDIEEKIVL